MFLACWKNILYILEHKLNVLVECWKMGLYIQGITHDWSKLTSKEFFPYTRKFFLKEKLSPQAELHWKYAWLSHQHKNKHHWEHWVIDPKKQLALPMPRKYLMEMVCDWRSFSRKWGRKVKTSTSGPTDMMILHPETRRELEIILKSINEKCFNSKKVN